MPIILVYNVHFYFANPTLNTRLICLIDPPRTNLQVLFWKEYALVISYIYFCACTDDDEIKL